MINSEDVNLIEEPEVLEEVEAEPLVELVL